MSKLSNIISNAGNKLNDLVKPIKKAYIAAPLILGLSLGACTTNRDTTRLYYGDPIYDDGNFTTIIIEKKYPKNIKQKDLTNLEDKINLDTLYVSTDKSFDDYNTFVMRDFRLNNFNRMDLLSDLYNDFDNDGILDFADPWQYRYGPYVDVNNNGIIDRADIQVGSTFGFYNNPYRYDRYNYGFYNLWDFDFGFGFGLNSYYYNDWYFGNNWNHGYYPYYGGGFNWNHHNNWDNHGGHDGGGYHPKPDDKPNDKPPVIRRDVPRERPGNTLPGNRRPNNERVNSDNRNGSAVDRSYIRPRSIDSRNDTYNTTPNMYNRNNSNSTRIVTPNNTTQGNNTIRSTRERSNYNTTTPRSSNAVRQNYNNSSTTPSRNNSTSSPSYNRSTAPTQSYSTTPSSSYGSRSSSGNSSGSSSGGSSGNSSGGSSAGSSGGSGHRR
jgi:uncharacterized membrane protein YgcG